MHAWAASRTLPKWRGGEFRRWLRQRVKRKPASAEATAGRAETGNRKE